MCPNAFPSPISLGICKDSWCDFDFLPLVVLVFQQETVVSIWNDQVEYIATVLKFQFSLPFD